jgi:glycosyltransferase involved in cell wall biosynthesis
MKVLHVHKITGVGGSERHLLTLLPALRERGIDARFLGLDVPASDADRFYRELEEAGVPAQHVRCGPDVSPRMAVDLVRAVRATRRDLLHTHLVHADAYGALAAAVTHTPLVSTRHNDDRYLLGPFRYVDRTLAHGARRLVAISEAVRRFLVATGHTAGKIETIHYGLDRLPDAPSEMTPADAGVPDGAPLVLAVGRLVPQKDHATLLRAFAAARERQPDAVLAVLGIGPLEQETRARAAELGLERAVLFPGRLELRDWLTRAQVFAHSSRWEGFGIVLLEAMLAGLPIAATRASAVPEVVADGDTGLLVEPGDWHGLGDALAALLADTGRARALGDAGRERARSKFSVAAMTDRTAALYERVLGRQ